METFCLEFLLKPNIQTPPQANVIKHPLSSLETFARFHLEDHYPSPHACFLRNKLSTSPHHAEKSEHGSAIPLCLCLGAGTDLFSAALFKEPQP